MYDITFIIPTYNNKKLLFRCLKSIENQLHENDRVIIIDDGSTDGTFKSVNEYYHGNPKIQIVQQINSGSGAARNKGVTLNQNRYIWFVDSDDYVVSNSVNKIRNEIKKNDLDILFFDFYVNNENPQSWQKLNIDPNDKTSLLLSLQVPWNKIIKAELFEKVRFPTGRIRYQDHGTIPLIISKGKQFKYVSEPFYVYDFSHPNNIGKNSSKNDDIYKAFENLLFYYNKGQLELKELRTLLIGTFVFSQIYNPSKNTFAAIYSNTKKVKKYLNKEYPKWRENEAFRKTFRDKYLRQVDKMTFKIIIGRVFRWSSILPSVSIFLYKMKK